MKARSGLKSVTCVQPIFPAGERLRNQRTFEKPQEHTAAMQFPSGEVSPLPISSISHLSRVVKDVEKSSAFYTNVLGFVPVRRPSSFDFEGSWVSTKFSLLGVLGVFGQAYKHRRIYTLKRGPLQSSKSAKGVLP